MEPVALTPASGAVEAAVVSGRSHWSLQTRGVGRRGRLLSSLVECRQVLMLVDGDGVYLGVRRRRLVDVRAVVEDEVVLGVRNAPRSWLKRDLDETAGAARPIRHDDKTSKEWKNAQIMLTSAGRQAATAISNPKCIRIPTTKKRGDTQMADENRGAAPEEENNAGTVGKVGRYWGMCDDV